jgi:hypothetical protein
MNNMKHTPGPWQLADHMMGVIGADHHIVCLQVERSADSRLIAAAPELLEALRMCEAEFITLRARLSEPYARNARICIETAQAAIAKAVQS